MIQISSIILHKKKVVQYTVGIVLNLKCLELHSLRIIFLLVAVEECM